METIESELLKLPAVEMRQVRDWLDDLLEDQPPFTEELEAEIRQSEQGMAEGVHARTRRPATGQ